MQARNKPGGFVGCELRVAANNPDSRPSHVVPPRPLAHLALQLNLHRLAFQRFAARAKRPQIERRLDGHFLASQTSRHSP
jgi:hypothetical protein